MSLFERIQNRILVEKKNRDSSPPDGSQDLSDTQKKFTKKNEREISRRMDRRSYQQQDLFDTDKIGKEDPVKDVKTTKDIIGDRKKKGRPIGSKNKTKDTSRVQTNLDLNLDKTDQKTIDQNRKAFRDLKRSKESGISQLNIDPKFNRKTGEYDAKRMREIEGDPKSKNIRQTIEKETDTKIRDFTQRDTNVTKGNETVTQTKKRPLRKGVDFFADPPEVVKARRQKLIQKRKYYEIDRKGNITDKGVEKYARNIKQSNLPLTQKDLDRARKFAVGGEKITNKAGEVIGTTTGKYGGKLAGTRKPKVKTQTPINQTFVNKTQQNRELQRQSRLNQRTTTTNVRKNPGLSDLEKSQRKGQKEFEKMFGDSLKRKININPNKTQQNRKTVETLRQTNKNRTVSDVKVKNNIVGEPLKKQIEKIRTTTTPKVERDIKTFINKTKQNRELQKQSRTNIFTKNNQTSTRTTSKPLVGQDLEKLNKQLDNLKKISKPEIEKLKTNPIKTPPITDPLRKPFDPLKTRKVTKTLKALKKPTMLGKLAKASPYLAVAGILGTNLYNRIKKSQKTQNTTKTPKPVPVVPGKYDNYKVDTTRLSFSGLDGGRIANDQFGNFKKS